MISIIALVSIRKQDVLKDILSVQIMQTITMGMDDVAMKEFMVREVLHVFIIHAFSTTTKGIGVHWVMRNVSMGTIIIIHMKRRMEFVRLKVRIRQMHEHQAKARERQASMSMSATTAKHIA